MRIVLLPACAPGGGHVVRCLALARALEALGARCVFVVEPLGCALLRRLGHAGEVVEAGDVSARRAAALALRPDAAVVDDYRLDAVFEAGLAATVMVVDDLADRPHACRLLLDSGYGRTRADYAALAPGAEQLLGPLYALLREGFAAPDRAPRPAVERVFIGFGLSDVGAIAARAVRILRPRLPAAAFDVALALDAQSLAPIRALAERDAGLSLHVDADVAPLMRAADLGVGAGGGMVWERRAAGLPQLVVALADNQRPMARRLAGDGVISLVDLQDRDFESRLAAAFDALLPVSARRGQLECVNAVCDGAGALRAARTLTRLVRTQ